VSLIKKSTLLPILTCLLATLLSGGAAKANLLENIADVAGGAAAVYGRSKIARDRIDLDVLEIEMALRLALAHGSEQARQRLAAEAAVKELTVAVLPVEWHRAREVAERFGYTRDFERLEDELVIAIQNALPQIDEQIRRLLGELRFSQVQDILYSDRADAATRYLWRLASDTLAREIRPFLGDQLQQTGVLKTSEKIASRLRGLPVGRLQADLSQHGLNKSLHSYFGQMAKAEARLRANPSSHPNEVVRRVFG